MNFICKLIRNMFAFTRECIFLAAKISNNWSYNFFKPMEKKETMWNHRHDDQHTARNISIIPPFWIYMYQDNTIRIISPLSTIPSKYNLFEFQILSEKWFENDSLHFSTRHVSANVIVAYTQRWTLMLYEICKTKTFREVFIRKS